ncbi:MAG: hypothetical protein HYT98_04140 [Candidatus Sungbacteria bacterium]|nr:hypothetical protein [Candidatus Sungbacteria bacterium]
MKWRATFADPKTPPEKRTGLEKRRVEIAADGENGLIPIADAIKTVEDKHHRNMYVGWVLTDISLVPDDDVEIEWLIPFPYARLAFDPVTTQDRSVRRIFRDQLARTVYLAVRYKHLIGPRFNQECLAATKLIRKRKPKTVHELRLIMRHAMPNNASGINEPFYTQFLPCVTGQKQIGYVVLPK